MRAEALHCPLRGASLPSGPAPEKSFRALHRQPAGDGTVHRHRRQETGNSHARRHPQEAARVKEGGSFAGGIPRPGPMPPGAPPGEGCGGHKRREDRVLSPPVPVACCLTGAGQTVPSLSVEATGIPTFFYVTPASGSTSRFRFRSTPLRTSRATHGLPGPGALAGPPAPLRAGVPGRRERSFRPPKRLEEGVSTLSGSAGTHLAESSGRGAHPRGEPVNEEMAA
jgi:hypothetical protein